MANYICEVGSNYVHVKDKDEFVEFLLSFECKPIYNNEGRIGFICEHPDGASPNRYDEETDDLLELYDASKEIGKHLCEGEVLIVEEIGRENMRYLVGVTFAFNHKGESLFVDMKNALREKVSSNWGVQKYTDATY